MSRSARETARGLERALAQVLHRGDQSLRAPTRSSAQPSGAARAGLLLRVEAHDERVVGRGGEPAGRSARSSPPQPISDDGGERGGRRARPPHFRTVTDFVITFLFPAESVAVIVSFSLSERCA